MPATVFHSMVRICDTLGIDPHLAPLRVGSQYDVYQGRHPGGTHQPVSQGVNEELRNVPTRHLFTDPFDNGAASRTGHSTAFAEYETNLTIIVVDFDVALND